MLIVIIKNKCLDIIKSKNTKSRVNEEIQSNSDILTFNNAKIVLVDENFEKLISCLPEKEKIILKLNLEGYKRDEISLKLNVSKKTISNSLSTSRNNIRHLWSAFME